MKVRLLTFLTAAILTISGCKTGEFYQVCEFQPNIGMQKNENGMYFENEDIRVEYFFINQNGQLRFSVKNKTEHNIFIDRSQSFWIVNDLAKEYYQARTTTNTSTSAQTNGGGIGTSIYGVALMSGGKVTNTTSHTEVEVERRFISIPPHAYKIFNGYRLQEGNFLRCDYDIDFPEESALAFSFNAENSELQCNNRIAYSTTEDGRNSTHVDNKFYLSSVQNFRIKRYESKNTVKLNSREKGCYEKEANYNAGNVPIYLPAAFGKYINDASSYYIRYNTPGK